MLPRWIKSVGRFLYEHTEGFLIAVVTTMLVLSVLLGILSRYVRVEVVFATELGKYLFIWLCAIGIAAAAKDHQHIRLDYFAKVFHLSARWTWLISQLLFLAFSLIFLYLGIRLTVMHFTMEKTAMGFHFPMYVFTAALPVGFLITAVRLAIDIVQCIKGKRPQQSSFK